MVCDVEDDLGLFFYAGYTCGSFKMHQFLVSSQKKNDYLLPKYRIQRVGDVFVLVFNFGFS